jgi:hypothetical protein
MSPKNHDGFTYRQRGPRVNSIASRLRVAAVVHSFDCTAKIFARATHVPLTRWFKSHHK